LKQLILEMRDFEDMKQNQYKCFETHCTFILYIFNFRTFTAFKICAILHGFNRILGFNSEVCPMRSMRQLQCALKCVLYSKGLKRELF